MQPDKPPTFDQIAERLGGISRQRVHALEKLALKSLQEIETMKAKKQEDPYIFERMPLTREEMPYRILCNGTQREGAKLSPALASELFCYVPLHKIRYGVKTTTAWWRSETGAGRFIFQTWIINERYRETCSQDRGYYIQLVQKI